MLRAENYQTGCYTSPHLVRYNERVRIDGSELDDERLIEAFESVESVRGDVQLTYFEYGTLAALCNFEEAGIDAAILEVGLGGRLDAVNAFDPDCAIVTSLDLDHQDWLGSNREDIGREKSGIFRPDKPAICGDTDPPASLIEHAQAIGASLWRSGKDFRAMRSDFGWHYESRHRVLRDLPMPALPGMHQLANAAAAIAALERMRSRFHVDEAAIRTGLQQARLAARFQILPGRPRIILDVAHNPAAALSLANVLADQKGFGRVIAVFGMLGDKDAAGVLDVMSSHVDFWAVGEIDAPRRMKNEAMQALLEPRNLSYRCFPNLREAWTFAYKEASEIDTILVFGSFYTVGAAIKAHSEMQGA
jgi:dihydrofolate synthase / folylpolyglutamate synthase